MDEASDDPTCIVNMLEEFRANAKNYYQSAMLPVNVFKDSACSSSKTKRLMDGRKFEIDNKKSKLETPQSKCINDEGNGFSVHSVFLVLFILLLENLLFFFYSSHVSLGNTTDKV